MIEQEQTIALTPSGDKVTTSWRCWRLSSCGTGTAGVLVFTGAAAQLHALPQQHAVCPIAERSLLQQGERLSFEQQVDFVLFVAQQEVVDDCTTSWRTVEMLSPQPQLAAGKDWTRSITIAIQALACVMIGLDAAANMASLSFPDSQKILSRPSLVFGR